MSIFWLIWWCMEKVFDFPKNFVCPENFFEPLKWYTGGGGGRRNKCVPQKNFSGLVGHNPKKSGKIISAPLIFSFPYIPPMNITQVSYSPEYITPTQQIYLILYNPKMHLPYQVHLTSVRLRSYINWFHKVGS
jgi:hypothetical protein